MRLLRLVSWPYVRKHGVRTVLTAAGVVMGVAVFVGMHAANKSVLYAFTRTIDRIAGKTELQITAGETSFAEDVLEKVQSAASVRVAAPVIEVAVSTDIPGQGNLLVLGVDMTGDRSLRDYDLEEGDAAVIEDALIFLAQPDSIMVSKEFADRNRLRPGSRINLSTVEGAKPFVIRGIMKPSGLASAFGGSLTIMDIYAAQKMFGRGRTIDRIDLAVKPGRTIADAQRELSALLGPAFDIRPPSSRGQQFESMLAGYSVMWTISSAFALFVGMFIIYNSFSIAVTQRRTEIGILRALGATRSQIRWLFLGESAALGLAGAAVGLVIGVGLARLIASSLSALVGDLYGVAQRATDITADPAVMGLALVIGLVTSMVAAAIPARHAARVDPVQALHKGRYQVLTSGENRVRVVAAAVLAAAAVVCLTIANTRGLFYLGYTLLIVVALLLAPLLTLQLARCIRPILGLWQPVEGTLAVDSLIQAPRRTSASVAALMLSLALVVAFAGMARASYGSIVDWMDTTLNPDLFVMPTPNFDLQSTRFPSSMAPELAALPGVDEVQMFRNGRISFHGSPVMVVATEMARVAQKAPQKPIAGEQAEMYRRAAAGEGVIVSDNLAQMRKMHLGDVLDIPAPRGAVRLPIVGIVMDYSDQQGAILMDRQVFVTHWGDDSVGDFRVYVKQGASIATVRQAIRERYAGKRQVFVMTNEDLRAYILNIVNQWFGLTNVQIAVAVLVAILGIVNTLIVSIMDRRRELGVLQAVGALRNQVRRMIWLEALSIGLLGLVLGCVFGAINLHYVLQIVQRDVAGLRLDYQFPLTTALALIPIILGSAFVAAIWPAEAAVRGALVEALEYE